MGQQFTPRQQQVAELIARGYDNKKIAQTLSISVRTVESHRAAIWDKIGITDISVLYRIINPSPIVLVLAAYPENTSVMVGAEIIEELC